MHLKVSCTILPPQGSALCILPLFRCPEFLGNGCEIQREWHRGVQPYDVFSILVGHLLGDKTSPICSIHAIALISQLRHELMKEIGSSEETKLRSLERREAMTR